jgi:ribosomal protein L6P/L9E
MSRSHFSRSAVFALTVAIGATGARADDDDHDNEGGEHRVVNGIVTAVDTTKKTVTFQEIDGTKVTVNVTTTTRIRINHMEGQTLAQLAAAVTAVPKGGRPYSGEAKVDNLTSLNARFINVSSHPRPVFVKGIITAVDTTKNTVTFQKTDGTKVTVNVPTNTRIEINDMEGQTLAQLAAAFKAVPMGGHPYSGVARVDDLTSLNAIFISVSNVRDDETDGD